MDYKKKKITGQQGELMRALAVSVDDLIANNEGYITEEQRVSLPKRQGYQWRAYKLLTGSCVFAGLLFLSMSLFGDDPISFYFSLFFFIISAILGYSGLYHHRHLKDELASSNFQTVQGIAVVNVNQNASYLEINGLKLIASPDVLIRISHLAPYIVHYLPNSKVILSMEHIADNDNIRQDERSSRLRDYDNSAESRRKQS